MKTPASLMKALKEKGLIQADSKPFTRWADLEKLLLDALLHDPVIQNLVLNPGCPVDVLEQLARDENPVVRNAALASPACPPELRESLIRDCFEPNTELATLDDIERGGLPPLARPSAPRGSITKAAKSRDWCDRLCVALNQGTTATILEGLLNDPREDVRAAAALTLSRKSRQGRSKRSRAPAGKTPNGFGPAKVFDG